MYWMEIKSAQQDMQSAFLRGSIGQMVSGLIWLASAILGTWVSEQYAIVVLAFVGIFIFPLTQLTLRVFGRSGRLSNSHPLNQLAIQVAFIVPFSLPLVGAASLYNINWFYPAFMLIVGVHYIPFIFLYGMWEFAGLSALLIGGGVAIGMLLPHTFVIGGWFTATTLLLFSVLVQVTPKLSRRTSDESKFPVSTQR
jgi:uncharacterized protein DUF7010